MDPIRTTAPSVPTETSPLAGAREIVILFLFALIGRFYGLDARDGLAFVVSLLWLALCAALPVQMLDATRGAAYPPETEEQKAAAHLLYWRRKWAWVVLFTSPIMVYYGIGFLNNYAAHPNGTLMGLVDEGLLSLLLTLRVFFLSANSHRSTSMQLQALVHSPSIQMAQLRREMDELQRRVNELDNSAKRASRLAIGLRNHLQNSIHVIHRVDNQEQEVEDCILVLEQRMADVESALLQTVRHPPSMAQRSMMETPLRFLRKTLWWVLGIDVTTSLPPSIPVPAIGQVERGMDSPLEAASPVSDTHMGLETRNPQHLGATSPRTAAAGMGMAAAAVGLPAAAAAAAAATAATSASAGTSAPGAAPQADVTMASTTAEPVSAWATPTSSVRRRRSSTTGSPFPATDVAFTSPSPGGSPLSRSPPGQSGGARPAATSPGGLATTGLSALASMLKRETSSTQSTVGSTSTAGRRWF